jgi:hypothetical protein
LNYVASAAERILGPPRKGGRTARGGQEDKGTNSRPAPDAARTAIDVFVKRLPNQRREMHF